MKPLFVYMYVYMVNCFCRDKSHNYVLRKKKIVYDKRTLCSIYCWAVFYDS